MTVLSFVNDYVLAAGSQSLADGIRAFVGPLLMLTMGIVAMTFLFKREMTQFLIFIVIAILVAVIFYGPDLIKGLAKDVSSSTGQNNSWNG